MTRGKVYENFYNIFETTDPDDFCMVEDHETLYILLLKWIKKYFNSCFIVSSVICEICYNKIHVGCLIWNSFVIWF